MPACETDRAIEYLRLNEVDRARMKPIVFKQHPNPVQNSTEVVKSTRPTSEHSATTSDNAESEV